MSPLETPLCPKCDRPMILEIQLDGARAFQCLKCDGIDPLKSPTVRQLLDALKPPSAGQ